MKLKVVRVGRDLFGQEKHTRCSKVTSGENRITLSFTIEVECSMSRKILGYEGGWEGEQKRSLPIIFSSLYVAHFLVATKKAVKCTKKGGAMITPTH